MYIDAHCHLSDPSISANLRPFIAEALGMGLSTWFLAGYDLLDWQEQMALDGLIANSEVKIFRSFGLHPWAVIEQSRENLERQWLRLEEMVNLCSTIGETGLDFFRDRQRDTLHKQSEYFQRHGELAKNHDKPLVLHVVRAHQETCKLLDSLRGVRGLVHAFRSSAEVAAQYVDRGFVLSFPAPILLKDAKLWQVFCQFRSHAVLETDAPNFSYPQGSNPLICLVKACQVFADRLAISPQELMASCRRQLSNLVPALD